MSTTIMIHGEVTSVKAERLPSAPRPGTAMLSLKTVDTDVTFFPQQDDLPALIARLRKTANLLSLIHEEREKEVEACATFGCEDRRLHL